MKKYLIKGALALFAGAFLFSCAEKESEYVPLAEQKVRAFEDVFKEVYGDNIDPYQRWGFSDKMVLADGDDVEPTLNEDSTDYAGIRTRMCTRAFTRAIPDQPTFRDNNPISKPTMPTSYKNTIEEAIAAGAKYAKDYQNYQSGDVIYINTDYQTLNNPQNTSNLTIYVDGTVTYEGQTKQEENGTTFCVTKDSKLILNQVNQYLNVYLAPGATLEVYNKYYDGGCEFSKTGALYLNSGSTVTSTQKLRFFDGYSVLNVGGTISVPTLEIDKNTTLWNEGSVTVTNELKGLNDNAYIYNASGKTISAGSISLNNNGDLLYNDGIVSSSGAITLQNTTAEIVNRNSISAASLTMAAGGKMHNYPGAIANITGLTKISNSNCQWMNDGQYTSGSFEVDQYAVQVYNNCNLIVNGQFWLNRGEFVLNGDASVRCNSFTWEDTSNFYLGSKSMLKVNGTLLTNNCNSGYGFRGYGSDYAVIQANAITHNGNEQFRMSYFGNLYIDTDHHFELWYKDYPNTNQPSYYVERSVYLKFMGDDCPVNIPTTTCNSGGAHIPVKTSETSSTSNTTETEEWKQVLTQSGRIFCEDLGQSLREDLDYNDVVFDVIIWANRKASTTTTTTVTTSYKDGVQTGQTSDSQTYGPYYTSWVYFAQVKLLAAGGTIPLTIGGKEVHNAFGVGVTTMVNTRDGNSTTLGSYVAKSPVDIGSTERSFTFDGQNYNLKLFENISKAQDVPIYVNYGDSQVAELEANAAKAPHKLFVPFNTQWTSERKPLDIAYPDFGDYVIDASKNWVNKHNDYYLYSEHHQGLATMPLVMKTKRVSGSETMDILTSTTYSYGSTWNLNDIYLNVNKFWPGDRLRFYGSGINENSYITVVFADGSKPYFIDMKFTEPNTDGSYPSTTFVEVLLDETYCEKLNNSKKDGKIMLQVQGRSFTLDKIARVPF